MKNLTIKQLRNCIIAYMALPMWFRILDIGLDVAILAIAAAIIIATYS